MIGIIEQEEHELPEANCFERGVDDFFCFMLQKKNMMK
jgi:hypothetical protein